MFLQAVHPEQPLHSFHAGVEAARSKPDGSPDALHLRDHFRQCTFGLGPAHRLACAMESVNAFLAPRFVTTLALLTAVVLVGLALPG